MKKWGFWLGIFLLVMAAEVQAKKGENGFFADQFLNQSQIVVYGPKNTGVCQAVRILPKWYLTAAHCVRPHCDKQCQISVRLLQGELAVSALVRHNTSVPTVFVPAHFNPENIKSVREDVALIRFAPAEEDYLFVDTAAGKQLDRKAFLKKLKNSAYWQQEQQWTALETARPKLWMLTNVFNRRIDTPIAVPKLGPEGIFFHTGEADSFYYFTDLHHFIGPNFGVEKGMSGGAVITPAGDVLGIVSANLGGAKQLVRYNEKDEAVGNMPYSSAYFLFAPLSRSTANFIRAQIGSYHDAGYGPNFVQISGSPARQTEQKLEDVFPQASSAEAITSRPIK